MVDPSVMEKLRESPSSSLAERVPERPEVVVSEESAVSEIEPAVGVLRTGGALLTLGPYTMLKLASDQESLVKATW